MMAHARMLTVGLLSVLAIASAGGIRAADWPQWLGAGRNGATTETVAAWTEPPKTLWTAELGPGFSAPVVAGGKVFIHARVAEAEREEMIAFESKSGKVLWRTAYDREPYSSVLNTGPQATPAVAAGRVYGFGITGMLTCFDADSGAIAWQVDTAKTLDAPPTEVRHLLFARCDRQPRHRGARSKGRLGRRVRHQDGRGCLGIARRTGQHVVARRVRDSGENRSPMWCS